MHPLKYAETLEARFRRRFSDKWYSRIELSPGEFTDGENRPNSALTRTLLGRTDVKGRDCADLAAVDGWCPILMCRRGAGRVAAFDRNDFTPLIKQVKKRLKLKFDYFPLVQQAEIPDVARKAGFDGFDVVVNSGLLYHVFGPINVLAATRSLVRTGGILIVETVVSRRADFTMVFNAAGMISPKDATTFWHITVPMFEYMLRMLRLVPLDVARHGVRCAIACRAVDGIPAAPTDRWMPRTYVARDYLDLTDWSILDKRTDEVGYSAPERPASKGGGIDVARAYLRTPPLAEPMIGIKLTDTI